MYHNSTQNYLPEDEPLVSKCVQDIKKLKYEFRKGTFFTDLYCMIFLTIKKLKEYLCKYVQTVFVSNVCYLAHNMYFPNCMLLGTQFVFPKLYITWYTICISQIQPADTCMHSYTSPQQTMLINYSL